MRSRMGLAVVGGLFLSLSLGLALSAIARSGSDAVSVHINKQAFRPGTTVEITVTNRTRKTIGLAGCATFTLEQFLEDHWEPMPPKTCPWEQSAILLKPGSQTFEYQVRTRDRQLIRVVVTYGIGCSENAPLSRARCARFGTAYSSSFTFLQARE